jgi:hypothetical protein
MTSYVWSLLGYEIEPEPGPEPEPEIPDYSEIVASDQDIHKRDSVLNQIKSLRLEKDFKPIEIFKKPKHRNVRKPHEFSWRDIASANPYSLEETNPGLL